MEERKEFGLTVEAFGCCRTADLMTPSDATKKYVTTFDLDVVTKPRKLAQRLVVMKLAAIENTSKQDFYPYKCPAGPINRKYNQKCETLIFIHGI